MRYAGLFSLLVCFFLSGCNPKESSVKLVTSGIFKPVLFQINDLDADGKTLDMGEHVLTDDPKELTVKVYNDTSYPYTELNLVLTALNDETPAIAFLPTPGGEINFPGHGGTCTKTLASKATCEMKLLFSPRIGRKYEEYLELKYKNYVGPESHKSTLLFLAGMPASLSFTNDTTQYSFGELIGPSRTAVIERADAIEYSQELEIVNAGGLSARSVSLQLQQTCVSTETNLCPTGMGDAFTYESNCPATLAPGEKCKVNVTFTPKNQDPSSGIVPSDILEINYRSTVTFAYIKDPHGATAGLNGYFKTLSTNIDARFKVSITTLAFEDAVVSGNRDSRVFRINNLGYREGAIKSIEFRDSGGAFLANCTAGTGSFLECRGATDNILTLEEFPYSVKDRNLCLRAESESPNYVSVGSGCIFDFFFQPSVNFLTDKPTEFLDWQPYVVFDSRWKGLEKIVKTKLFNLSAKSIAAARLVLQRVRYESIDVDHNSPVDVPGPWVTDLGRLTLQSINFYRRKPLTITFKNVGSIPATGISMQDGRGSAIPIGGIGSNLGPHSPQFYTSAIASSGPCGLVAPGSSCSMTISFAPIGMNTPTEEEENMFDATDENGISYKSFRVNYVSGSLYTDLNIDGDPDYTTQTAEARLQAVLVRKGMLMQLADDARNKTGFGSNFNVIGDTIQGTFFIQNIGTGPVPYLRANNPPTQSLIAPSSARSLSSVIMPTPNYAALGADHDCLGLVDIDLDYVTDGSVNPSTRTGNSSALGVDESCAFTVEMSSPAINRFANATSCNDSVPATVPEELHRLWSQELKGSTSLWDHCGSSGLGSIGWSGINILYYDGDFSAPGAVYPVTYGNLHTLTPWTFNAEQRWHAKLIPYHFNPWFTATLYRPQIDLPTLSPTKLARTIPEAWFYGTHPNLHMAQNDPTQLNLFVKAGESRNFASTLDAFDDKDDYDYIYYVGSVPQNSPSFSFPLTIRNFGSKIAKIISLSSTSDPGINLITAPTLPHFVSPMTDINPLMVTFTPTLAGEHRMVLDYQYEDGAHTATLVYQEGLLQNAGTYPKVIRTAKILVVGHVMATNTHPQLTLDVTEFSVEQNPSPLVPTEIEGTTAAANLTWNTAPTSSTLVFETIKLTAAATPNDVYAMKRLHFKNETAFPIHNLKILYRLTETGSLEKKFLSNEFRSVGEDPATDCVSDMTLPAGATCSLSFRYQPGSANTGEDFILTAQYATSSGQYLMQNLKVTLVPLAPGMLNAGPSVIAEQINYIYPGASNPTSRTSYPLNFGIVTLDSIPEIINFDQTSGLYQRLQMFNSEGTKASLLLAYQSYLETQGLKGYNTTSNRAPSSEVPAPGDYETIGAYDFVTIHRSNYTNGSARIIFKGSKGCLFGDDETNAAIPAHQKGFNNVTSSANPCIILVTFNASLDYIADKVDIVDGLDMQGTASEIKYYSVFRSSTNSFWVHLKGTLNPDPSIANGTYSDIKAFENRTVSITAPTFDATTIGVGPVVGVRIIMASSEGILADPYQPGLTNYIDIRPVPYDNTVRHVANFTSGLANGTYFYYRAVAIRRHNGFTVTGRFPGLGPGEYLSKADNLVTPVKLLVPPPGHYYFHEKNAIVEKDLYAGVRYENYATASARCTNHPKYKVKPTNVNVSYKLITKEIWNLLVATPTATNYANMHQIFHWTSDPPVTVDSQCAALPEFLAGENMQDLASSSVFYYRGTNYNGLVNQAVGGVPSLSAYNYQSYVTPVMNFGSARCMAIIP